MGGLDIGDNNNNHHQHPNDAPPAINNPTAAACCNGKGDDHNDGAMSNAAATANSAGSILSTGAVSGWKRHPRDHNRPEGARRWKPKLRESCNVPMRRDGFWRRGQ